MMCNFPLDLTDYERFDNSSACERISDSLAALPNVSPAISASQCHAQHMPSSSNQRDSKASRVSPLYVQTAVACDAEGVVNQVTTCTDKLVDCTV